LDTHQVIIIRAPGITQTIDLALGVMGFNVSHTYTETGEYQVLVTISDDNGGLTNQTFTVITRPWFMIYSPGITR
jgi:hypothetical protein